MRRTVDIPYYNIAVTTHFISHFGKCLTQQQLYKLFFSRWKGDEYKPVSLPCVSGQTTCKNFLVAIVTSYLLTTDSIAKFGSTYGMERGAEHNALFQVEVVARIRERTCRLQVE